MTNTKTIRMGVAIFSSMTLAALSINTSQAQNQKPSTDQKMNCDSTCLVPSPMDQPKVNIASTTKDVGQFQWGPKCGASAGSVVPSVPSAFLCEDGNTASAVSTTTADGETVYKWSCTNAGGTSTMCNATQREAGVCGSDSGKTLTQSPTNLCSSGASTGFSLSGNQYKWQCQGNYGAPASCAATKGPVCEMVSIGEQCGTSIVSWQAASYTSIWLCGYEPYTYWCEPIYGPYTCSEQYEKVCH